jgi:cytochrome c-type biogenesis protein CcmH/NrfF
VPGSRRRRALLAGFRGLLAGMLVLAGVSALPAVGARAADRAEEAWAYDLARDLMSPYCPGRALAECPSPQADQLRLWILEQARAGASREQVEAQLLQTFGDQLLQAPRAEGVGLVAYVVPAVLIVAGAGLLALFLRRQSAAAAAERARSAATSGRGA